MWSIELIWVSTYGKMEEKHIFWAFLETCTGTPLDCTGTTLQNRTCTGTGQSCTGTGSVMFFYFDQRLYFGHNLLISYPI